MANKTLNTRIIIRNDTAAAWQSANPVLRKGEIGIVFDPSAEVSHVTNFKIGDGVTAWNSLPLMITTEDIEALAQRVGVLEGTVATHGTQIAGLEATVATHTSQISGLDSTVATHTSQISGLESTVATHTTQISGIEGKLDGITATVTGAISSAINNLYEDKIVPLGHTVDVLVETAGVAGSVEYKIAQHASDYDAAGAATAAEAAAKQYADNKVSGLSTVYLAASYNEAIAGNTAAIATHSAQLAGITGTVVGEIAGAIASLNTVYLAASYSTTISGLTADVAALSASVAGLDGDVDNLSDKLDSTIQTVQSQGDAIATINSVVAGLGTVYLAASYSNAIAGNTAAIATLNATAGVAGSVAAQVAAEASRAQGVEQGLDARIDALEGNHFVIVQTLPATGEANVIYLVPKASPLTGYKEWLYVKVSANPDTYSWEEIGDTDIDLSNYYNKSEVDAIATSTLASANTAAQGYVNALSTVYLAASYSAAIAGNTSAIATISSTVAGLESDYQNIKEQLDDVQLIATANQAAIAILNATEGVAGSVEYKIASYSSKYDLAGAASAALASANQYTDGKVDIITASIAGLSTVYLAASYSSAIAGNTDAIATVGGRVGAIEADYLKQADVLILDCGNATSNYSAS